MKKSIAVLSTLIALGVAGGLYFGVSKSEASATPEHEAKQAITHYLDALKSGNVNEIMKYTDDTRFADENTKREEYARMAKYASVKSAELVSLNVVDNTEITAGLKISTSDGTVQEVTLPLALENGQWKVVIKRNNN